MRLYDAADGELLASYVRNSAINAVAISPNSRRLALGQADGDVVLADVATDPSGAVTVTHLRTLVGHTGAVNSVAFATIPSGFGTRFLAS